MNTETLLVEKIENANEAYRKGEPMISDTEYDTLLEELEVMNPNHPLLDKVGLEVSNDRKVKLPIIMASMNKVKTVDSIFDWFRTKDIPSNTKLVLTPKYDGLSLCTDEGSNKAYTRGDGVYGQLSTEHLLKTGYTFSSNIYWKGTYFYGEMIMKRSVFQEKYSVEFSNPRNLVAGQMNHKTPNDILKDCDFIPYGIEGNFNNNFNKKSKQLEWLNSNKSYVPFKVVNVNELSEDYLLDLYKEWSQEYEIDGIIVEVDDFDLRERLGRETSSNNPKYARAYKGNFEEVKETVVENITWNISKQGLLKPVINVKTISLDGVNVSNVTGNNAKFMKEMGIGIGSRILVKRSGMVIPLVVSVVESTGFQMPDVGTEIEWNENDVELRTVSETEEQRFKKLVSFFEILGVENLATGTLRQFFDNNFTTPLDVLRMTKEDMLKMDKFGSRKADKVIQSINEKRKVTLSKLQHASGFFKSLGSKKLLLLEGLENPSKQDILNVEGFSEISVESYFKGIELFNEWVKPYKSELEIVLTENNVVSNDLEGKVFVFTGIRRKDLNEIIESRGGKVGSSVSGKTTHLVMKQKGSGSSKEKKAIDLGVTIMEVEELEEFLK
jgi:DNA ligase (NAD+)